MIMYISNVLLIIVIYHFRFYLHVETALQEAGRAYFEQKAIHDDSLIPETKDRKHSHTKHHHHFQRHHHHQHRHLHPNNRARSSRAIYIAVDSSKLNRSANRIIEDFGQHSNTPLAYQNDQQSLGINSKFCCACDEAKYELVFEGLWSKYTHPDDFPENYWLARFSDIIGASHSSEFTMWKNDEFATEGVRELAETGSTKKLESELKQVSSKTRTIIKARELHYPTLNSKTSAVFRTDRLHHLVSILSKLSPSPDWMVGVSGLELCQADCSWATQRVVNLHLWDAGTDSGTTFTAPDFPTYPHERIHPFRKIDTSALASATTRKPITTDQNGAYPYNDDSQQKSSSNNEQPYSSSFIDSSQESMVAPPGNAAFSSPIISEQQQQQQQQSKPFARLTITRQRIYEKSCSDLNSYQPNKQQSPPITSLTSSYLDSWLTEPTRNLQDCRYTDWSDWSTCSSICGRGIRTRTRALLDEQANQAACSHIDLIEKEICISECIGNTTCITRDWSEWSQCSVHCGHGQRKRTRSPIGPSKRVCESLDLVEIEVCVGAQGTNCNSDLSSCEVSEWSQWSDCSVACGKGTRIRTRQYLSKEGIETCSARLVQKQSCTGRPELCKQSSRVSSAPSLQQQQKPNINLPVIDCKLSAWSPWSTCSALCGNGKRTRSRYIIQMPQNGGKPCDKKLSRTQKCKDLPPCPPDYVQQGTSRQLINSRAGIKQHVVGPISNRNAWLTTTTTQANSMMDDDDDTKFSRLIQSESSSIHSTPSFSSIINNDHSASTSELELIGSTRLHIRNGFIYFNSSDSP